MNSHGPHWRFTPSFIEFVCLVMGSVLVFWYSWIMDDAYVYFRYVDNWIIHGQGLVWNSGEYVEGFSSPLWVILLGVLRSIHLDYLMIIRCVALLCFILFWYVACLVNRGFMPDPTVGSSFNIPLIYLSFTYAVACYFSSGLESPLVNITAVIYAASILWPQSMLFQALIGLSPLVRHEFVIPLVFFLAWSLFVKRVRPITTLVAFVFSVGGYGIFRVWYYADFLPNTFYLKDATSIRQGLYSLYDSFMPYFTVPYLATMVLIYWILSRHMKTPLWRNERLAMIAIALPVMMYSVKIGGDPRHFRYLAFPFILLIMAGGGLVENITARLPVTMRRYLVMFLLIFGFSVGLCYPRQLQQHPVFRSHFGFSHSSFLNINDAVHHRFHDSGITPPWHSLGSFMSYNQAELRYESGFTRASGQNSLSDGSNPRHHARSTYRPPPLESGWCHYAYLNPASPVIHSLGLSEPFLARTHMPAERSAHKCGLMPLAKDLQRVRAEYGFGIGVFDHAMTKGEAPAWICKNIESIRKIEKKAYNDHNFMVNFTLALSPSPWIDP